jgi:hypothetical protein
MVHKASQIYNYQNLAEPIHQRHIDSNFYFVPMTQFASLVQPVANKHSFKLFTEYEYRQKKARKNMN